MLKSLRIIKNRDGGLTVGYPAQMGRDKTWHDVVEPKSESLREEIDRRVLADYARAVKQIEAEEAEEAEPAEVAPEPSPS